MYDYTKLNDVDFTALLETIFGTDVDTIFGKTCCGNCAKDKAPKLVSRNEIDKSFVEIDLPGYKKEEVSIEATPKALIIKVDGVRGKYTYTQKLTEAADIGKITSKLEDGVLQIVVPVKIEAQPIQIKVQ